MRVLSRKLEREKENKKILTIIYRPVKEKDDNFLLNIKTYVALLKI